MSDQDTETKETPDSSEAPGEKSEAPGEKEVDVDHLSDLSELEKIKLELQQEKEKAAQELAAGEEEEEDLREVDYLQKLITLSAVSYTHLTLPTILLV